MSGKIRIIRMLLFAPIVEGGGRDAGWTLDKGEIVVVEIEEAQCFLLFGRAGSVWASWESTWLLVSGERYSTDVR